MQFCIKTVLKINITLQSNKYFWPVILFGEKMADGAGASMDNPEQPEGIFQLIDKLESIVDQIAQG